MHDMGTQQFQNQNSSVQVMDKLNSVGCQNGSSSQSKPVIERGASWGYGETRILLALWGQDMVQRQLTNSKRTRHVWEKIAERIKEHGYDRTADQVRTRVFNMIAEYRRILKNPTPERKKKCIFFDALHKIYQAKDTNSLESAILSYGDEHYNFDPIDFTNNDENMDTNGDDNSENDEPSETFAYTMSPTGLNNSVNGNMNDLNSNDDSLFGNNDDIPLPQAKRCRIDNSSLNETFGNAHPTMNSMLENSASALLIDRMFAHLSKETEVMREWVNLERERLAQEIARRKEEKEREERREKSFLEVLTKLQEQVFTFLSKQQQQQQQHHLCTSFRQSCSAASAVSTSSNEPDRITQEKLDQQ